MCRPSIASLHEWILFQMRQIVYRKNSRLIQSMLKCAGFNLVEAESEANYGFKIIELFLIIKLLMGSCEW